MRFFTSLNGHNNTNVKQDECWNSAVFFWPHVSYASDWSIRMWQHLTAVTYNISVDTSVATYPNFLTFICGKYPIYLSAHEILSETKEAKLQNEAQKNRWKLNFDWRTHKSSSNESTSFFWLLLTSSNSLHLIRTNMISNGKKLLTYHPVFSTVLSWILRIIQILCHGVD